MSGGIFMSFNTYLNQKYNNNYNFNKSMPVTSIHADIILQKRSF